MRKIMTSAFALCSLTAAVSGAVSGAAHAQSGPAAAADESAQAVVIVTGTRSVDRTQFDTLSPVDVLDGEEVNASASNELVDAIAQIVPSFNVQRLPAADGLIFVRPATLRNLSPDQTLVLLNGKRRHRSALLGSRGAQAPDLAQIPASAIQRIEVLRDGASAQYGSDAIAGVINIILDEDPTPEAFAQVSQYYEGDGMQTRAGVKAGAVLGDGGFFVAGAEWAEQEATSRTRQRPDAITFQAANPTLAVPNPVQRWGQPDLELFRLTFNGEAPFGEAATGYLFATYGQGQGVSDFNWRNPAGTANAYNPTPAFPGFNLRSIYPAGFTPRFQSEDNDSSLTAGVRGGFGDNFTWDFSASTGRNQIDYSMSESINASLGPLSPTSFDLGTLTQHEFNLNADANYRWEVGLAAPVNLAFGAERRVETYTIGLGEPASYAVGPGAQFGLAPNANGFPGFGPQQAGSWDQESYAAYVDVEAPLTASWTVGAAGRFEDFSEFGDNFSGKLSTRYEFVDWLAGRASYSTGFRAPTPGQLNASSVVQGLDTVTLQLFNTGRLSPSDPLAVALGAQPLTPEESETISAGFALNAAAGFTASLDAYEIKVTDRFSESPTRPIPAGVPNPNRFTGVRFFTNDFDTTTRGVDLVVGWDGDLLGGQVGLTAAYNYNETTVDGGATSIAANATQRRIFEEGRPQHNAAGSASYARGPFEVGGRVRYYGEWTDVSGNTTGDLFQTFGGITLVDVSVDWELTDRFAVRVGAENVFDEYPDEATNQAVRGLIYSRNAPYDTDGGLYYVRLNARF